MKDELRKNHESISGLQEENQSLKIKLDDQINQISNLQLKERKIMMALKMKNMAQQSDKTSVVNSKNTSVVNSKAGSKREIEFAQSEHQIQDRRNRDRERPGKSLKDVSRSKDDRDSRSRKSSTTQKSQRPSILKSQGQYQPADPEPKPSLFQSFKNLLGPKSPGVSRKDRDEKRNRDKSSGSRSRHGRGG